ncbi:MAG TPA: PfkB family carbohydrate kinase [Actinomycetota bacterium]|nr:PfkB family carbohydrate kinase [Actinomycetota bacterium]
MGGGGPREGWPEGRPDLVVVGDVMVDVAVEAAQLARGGDVHGTVLVRPAGSGANAAVWAASAGARVRLYGRVGDDLAGRLLTQALAGRGVDARLAVDPGARTGAMLVVRERDERSMVADRGANARLAPADLPKALDATAVLASGYLLFDPGSEGAARAALERARARWVAVDAASWPLLQAYGRDRFFEATEAANVLFANELEVRALAREPGAAGVRRQAVRLAARFELVCVKLGARGALAVREGYVAESPAPEVEEADPTGAGDAFDGVFLAALVQGLDLEEALWAACEAGARAAASTDTWPPEEAGP